jgi:tRNA(fMet)-specific endonuclease VapC
MATVLLDTDVVSFLLKGDSRAAGYRALIQGDTAAISFMTVAELFQWATVRKWGNKRVAQLEQTINSYLVLPADLEMCRRWAAVRAARAAAGMPISPQDAWIAATALRHNLPLITHNAGDYQAIANLDIRTATQP